MIQTDIPSLLRTWSDWDPQTPLWEWGQGGVHPLWSTGGQSVIGLGVHVPCGPTGSLPGTDSTGLFHQKTRRRAQTTQKSPTLETRCLLTGRRGNRLWYVHAMGYHTAGVIKRVL